MPNVSWQEMHTTFSYEAVKLASALQGLGAFYHHLLPILCSEILPTLRLENTSAGRFQAPRLQLTIVQ